MKNIRLFVGSVITALPMTFIQPVMAQSDSERMEALVERIEQLEQDTVQVEDLTQIQRVQRALGFYLDRGRVHVSMRLASRCCPFTRAATASAPRRRASAR